MISLEQLLPTDRDRALLVGRVFDPEVEGPCICLLYTSTLPTTSRG